MRRIFIALLIAGCSGTPTPDAGNNDSGTPDAGTHDAGTMGNLPDGGFSACGFPGDLANDAGVGQYCLTINDCPTAAPICSSFQNSLQPPDKASFFCVATCDQCDPAGVCGFGATCVCQASHECGCVPNRCSALFFDAGFPCDTADAGDGGH